MSGGRRINRSELNRVEVAAQLHAEAGAPRLRPGSRAACLVPSAMASRRLQIASRCFSLVAATGAPLRLRHAGPAAQLESRWTTNDERSQRLSHERRDPQKSAGRTPGRVGAYEGLGPASRAAVRNFGR